MQQLQFTSKYDYISIFYIAFIFGRAHLEQDSHFTQDWSMLKL